jgi:NAD(P)-dependent dehydrogenase (short-subunit alcohol dehydrogenase family)
MEYPQFTLHGQVALVTGAARGLGRAISLALAHAGADVALGLRDLKADAGLAAEILKMGRRALPLQMDMRRMEQIQSAVDEAEKKFGRIDILVNNAGIAPENWAEDVREEDFDATLDVNRKDYQHEFAGRVCGIAHGIDLLHDQGGDCAFDEMPGGGMGQARDHGERGGADIYPHAGDRECTCRCGVSRGHSGTDRGAAPNW